ncbi:hypothetical protein RRF57_000767 [Xylaria bambusicola]|uniref:Myb-like domain-containing protein n=1 Tax=Xylaria bambusicola TaxID=326684 RepID=A0AAN7UGA7_9PEZI
MSPFTIFSTNIPYQLSSELVSARHKRIQIPLNYDYDTMADRGMKKWSEEEKVIGQFITGGAKLNLSTLSFPGRTPKALENQWDKLRSASLAAVGAGKAKKSTANDSSPDVKNGLNTPGNRKRTAQAAGLTDNGDGSPVTPTPTPTKRGRKAAQPHGKHATHPQLPSLDEDKLNAKVKAREQGEPIFKYEEPIVSDYGMI